MHLLRSGSTMALLIAASLNAIALAAVATPAHAQDASSGDAVVTAEDETIVVTGSRIARPELSFPNPVQVITTEAVEQSGKTNLTEFLIDTPALLGSQSNQDVAGSNLRVGTHNHHVTAAAR